MTWRNMAYKTAQFRTFLLINICSGTVFGALWIGVWQTFTQRARRKPRKISRLSSGDEAERRVIVYLRN